MLDDEWMAVDCVHWTRDHTPDRRVEQGDKGAEEDEKRPPAQ